MVKVAECKRTCNACPSQWEGKLEDGRSFYARYRHGIFRYGVANPGEDPVEVSFSNSDKTTIDPEGWGGFLTDPDFMLLMNLRGWDFKETKWAAPLVEEDK